MNCRIVQDGGISDIDFAMLLTRLPTNPIGRKMRVATTFADASTKYMVENPCDSHRIGKHGPFQVQTNKVQMQNAKAFRNCWLRPVATVPREGYVMANRVPPCFP